jgi:molecular chaperone DnaK
MKEEAKANAEEDQKAKEKIEKLNKADSLIFQTDKQLKEFGDKLSDDKKKPIESALEALRDAHKNEKIDELDQKMEDLNKAWQAASEEMYKAQQEAGGQQGGGQQAGGQQSDQGQSSDQKGSSSKGGDDDDEVTDVDFEEVK